MDDDLFAAAARREGRHQPLAERMRPRHLDEVVGQDHVLAPNKPLRAMLASDKLPSLILWGPPGSGKTSLARLLASAIGAHQQTISAVSAGVKDIRQAMETAKRQSEHHRRRTVLFIDEIHRFHSGQQDALLPHVEAGVVILVGATTQNPSYELNRALLSRCRVITLRPLTAPDLQTLLATALSHAERGLGALGLIAQPKALAHIAAACDGDARRALSWLEVAATLAQRQPPAAAGMPPVLCEACVLAAAPQRVLAHDRDGDLHHQVVSAFIKSMRGSDPDAAVYYLMRLLEAGEAPRFVLRRMVILASEDIGNACPEALGVAMAACQAFELMGLPEGILPLVQAATYLACAAKSNAVLHSQKVAQQAVRSHGALPVPQALQPVPPGGGPSASYANPHASAQHINGQSHLPTALRDRIFYAPTDQGEELCIAQRLARWRQLRRQGARPA